MIISSRIRDLSLLIFTAVLGCDADEQVSSEEEFLDDDAQVEGVDIIGALGSDPLIATKPCEGDNDWSGGTSCFYSVTHSGWTFASSTAWGYHRNDVRYTSSSSATGKYRWTAPKNGTAKFWVWIPSNKATADVLYTYGCATSGGNYSETPKTVNQNNYYSQWVELGSKPSKLGFECWIDVKKSPSATASEIMAMDGVQIDFIY